MGKKGHKKSASHAQGRPSGSQTSGGVLNTIQQQVRDLYRGDAGLQPILDTLRGPQGRRIVAADVDNNVLFVALMSDLQELAMLRLQLGGGLDQPVSILGRHPILPLHVAVWALAPLCVEAMIRAGADPNAISDNWVPLRVLALPETNLASQHEHVRQDRVAGASQEEEEHQAVLRIAKCLRGAGADITARDQVGHCPIVAAIYSRMPQRAAVLLRVFSEASQLSQHAKMSFGIYLQACAKMDAKEGGSSWPIDERAPLARLLGALHASWQPGGGLPLSTPDSPFRCAERPAGSHQPHFVLASLRFALQRDAAVTLVWLLASCDAEVVWRAWDSVQGKRDHSPLIHAALQNGQLPPVRVLQGVCDVAALDCSGVNVLQQAFKHRKQAFVVRLSLRRWRRGRWRGCWSIVTQATASRSWGMPSLWRLRRLS